MDEVISADVAAKVAQQAGLLVTLNVANRADTLNAQINTASSTQDATTAVVDKPQLIAPSIQSVADIQTITTKEGDTVPSLATRYGISEDTIRWANNLSSDALAPGTKLTILPTTGVLYTVQASDTVDALAGLYQTTAEQITAFNDLELAGLKPGSQIIIPNGVKPVPSIASSTSRSSSKPATGFSYGTTTASFSGNRYAYGYCTYYAYNKRAEIGRPVASNWGNASSWAALARSSGFNVDKSPQAGDVLQTGGGYGGYGHVAFVERVNADGSIFVSEMNYAGWNIVSTRTVPADQVGIYNYIH